MKFWTKTHSFTDGAARLFDLCYFSVIQDDLAEEEVSHTVFAGFDQQKWYQYAHVNWTSVGIVFATQPSEKAVAISENGQVWTYFGGQEHLETLNKKPKLIRNISTIKGQVYVCGMDRQVFHRIHEQSWVEVHAPVPKKGETLGFEAITGFSEKEIYAVGWEGEIWRFDGSNWHNCDSPVNLILTGVYCASDGNVYICGQNGTILKGRKDTWVVIDDDVTQDIWDLIEFNGKIYFATKSDVYVLSNDTLRVVILESDEISTAGRFTARENVLWSIGDKDVFSFDGITWSRID